MGFTSFLPSFPVVVLARSFPEAGGAVSTNSLDNRMMDGRRFGGRLPAYLDGNGNDGGRPGVGSCSIVVAVAVALLLWVRT